MIDSGYASAAEEDEESSENEGDVLRADPIERAFAVRWLTTFIARSEDWTPLDIEAESAAIMAGDHEERLTAVVEEAACVLAALAEPAEDADDTDGAVVRPFSFPTVSGCAIDVVLNDAPLSDEDHTSVGLQSWGASIVLSERLCANPAKFGFHPTPTSEDCELRVLELGAGTGLLSLVLSKLFSQPQFTSSRVPTLVATDYHPAVLANLQHNVTTNFPSQTPLPISVHALDWSTPTTAPPFNMPYDVLLAADVVYHVEHATWLRDCASKLLSPEGVFWLIVTLRSTGRHEGVADTVEQVFPPKHNVCGTRELAILDINLLEKQKAIGRADEGGYKLYKIGWVGQ